MDTPKNFMDAWMNTQSKLVDNLVDTSKKLQESIKKGEVVEKSVEMYSNWFDKQKGLADSVIGMLKNQWTGKEETPDYFKRWVESQVQFGKQWLELLNKQKPNLGQGKPNEYFNNMNQLYQEWTKVYGNLFQQTQSRPSNFFPFNSSSMPGANLGQLIDNTRTYMKMFELWQPIYKMMQSNTMGIDSLPKIMDLDKYKEALDGIFQFMGPEKSTGFLEMIQNYSQSMLNTLQSRGMLPNIKLPIDPMGLMDKNISNLAQMSEVFTQRLQQVMNPYFTMIPAGKEKELIAKIQQLQDRYSRYYVKASEMQNLVYHAGQKAMERSVQSLMNKSREEGDSVSFDDFYSLWVNTMEEEIIQLFGSETYSKHQGSLLKIALEIKGDMDSLMENVLSSLPLVPRSEMDDVNATIYELKSKMRTLESKLEALDQQKKKSD